VEGGEVISRSSESCPRTGEQFRNLHCRVAGWSFSSLDVCHAVHDEAYWASEGNVPHWWFPLAAKIWPKCITPPPQSVSMVMWAESSVFGFYFAEGGGMLRDVIPCSVQIRWFMQHHLVSLVSGNIGRCYRLDVWLRLNRLGICRKFWWEMVFGIVQIDDRRDNVTSNVKIVTDVYCCEEWQRRARSALCPVTVCDVSCAGPPGPATVLSVVPDVIAIWRCSDVSTGLVFMLFDIFLQLVYTVCRYCHVNYTRACGAERCAARAEYICRQTVTTSPTIVPSVE